MAERSTWDAQARAAFAHARDPASLATAVVRFHKRVDEVVAATVQGHSIAVACRPGCSYCCSLQVHVTPYEAFALADWLKRKLAPQRLQVVTAKLAENAARTRAAGDAGRKRMNIACALLSEDGTCGAYEARPAQCRRFHSLDVEVCKASYANPADDSIESANHPALAHNAQVIDTQTALAVKAQGLDATPVDVNLALLEALENPKAWRRWKDGKKAFVTGNPPKG